MTLPPQVRLILRHLAVLYRWRGIEQKPPDRTLYREWDAEFYEERRGLTREQLIALLAEHAATLRALAAHETERTLRDALLRFLEERRGELPDLSAIGEMIAMWREMRR